MGHNGYGHTLDAGVVVPPFSAMLPNCCGKVWFINAPKLFGLVNGATLPNWPNWFWPGAATTPGVWNWPNWLDSNICDWNWFGSGWPNVCIGTFTCGACTWGNCTEPGLLMFWYTPFGWIRNCPCSGGSPFWTGNVGACKMQVMAIQAQKTI